MKLATLRIASDTAAAVGVDGGYLPLGPTHVGELLKSADWRARVDVALHEYAMRRGPAVVPAADAQFAAVVPYPGKVVCCGLNYAEHIREMGREAPEYPTLFAKFADTLTGAYDAVDARGSEKVDWEAELAVVIGRELREVTQDEARSGIAGYTVANDISMRDWQNRTLQWLQGKVFDASTPVGPVLATAEEFGANPRFEVRGYVNEELVQCGDTSTLLFSPARLVAYISEFTTLRPGDLVLTGTPSGVGSGLIPPRYLTKGDVLATEIDGIGRLENTLARAEAATSTATAPV